MIRVDANYILRYLLSDNSEMANIAEQLFLTRKMGKVSTKPITIEP